MQHVFCLHLALIVCVLFSSFTVAAELLYCNTARHNCITRTGCQMALHNFFIRCSDVINKKTDVCTIPCKQALVSLLSTEDQTGQAFVNCNCNGSAYCEDRKYRVERCKREVFETMKKVDDQNSIVSCAQARYLCEADTSCQTALRFYMENCHMLANGRICTPQCNNSLAILYSQTKASKLRTCRCDGTEGYDCEGVRERTMKYCFHREVPYSIAQRDSTPPPKRAVSSAQNQFNSSAPIVRTHILLVVLVIVLTYHSELIALTSIGMR